MEPSSSNMGSVGLMIAVLEKLLGARHHSIENHLQFPPVLVCATAKHESRCRTSSPFQPPSSVGPCLCVHTPQAIVLVSCAAKAT